MCLWMIEMLNKLLTIPQQNVQDYITLAVMFGVFLPVSIIMLILAYRTYLKDRLYLANIFLAITFTLIAFMFLLNIFIIYIGERCTVLIYLSIPLCSYDFMSNVCYCYSPCHVQRPPSLFKPSRNNNTYSNRNQLFPHPPW